MNFCSSSSVLRIREWLRADTFRARLTRNSAIVASSALLSRAGGAVIQMVLAYLFGTQDAIDAYLLALTLALFLQNVLVGTLRVTVIPVFVKAKQEGGLDAARHVVACAFGITLVGGVVLVAVALLAAQFILPWISAFPEQKLVFTHQLLCLLCPLLIISSLSFLGTSFLQAVNVFFASGLAMVLVPCVTLVVLLLFSGHGGIYALVGATLFASLTELTVIAFALKRQRILTWPALPRDERLRQAMLQGYLTVAAGSFIMANSTIVNQAMASMLEAGSVATLVYGGRVPSVFMAIPSLAIVQVLFPEFSKIAAEGDYRQLRAKLNGIVLKIFWCTSLAAALLILFSEPLTRILFERGKFSADDTIRVHLTQVCYSLEIPFYVSGIVVVQGLAALGTRRAFFWFGLLFFSGTILGNYIFMHYFGAPGIALSTGLVYLLLNTGLFIHLQGMFRKIERTSDGGWCGKPQGVRALIPKG